MSFAAFAATWSHSRATGNTFLVHLALADLAQVNLVQAAQADIALLARCSVPTVSRALQELISLGEVIALDDRVKPPIYQLQFTAEKTFYDAMIWDATEDKEERPIHPDFEPTRGIGLESDPFRARSVDNLQDDGMLQDDGNMMPESNQVEGELVQRTSEEKTSPNVRPPFEATIGLDMPTNIGQPIPVMATPDEVVMKTLAEVQDAAAQALREQTGVAAATFQAVARSVVAPMASDPVAELSAFLVVLGVKPNPEVPLYWFRDEHVQDFIGLLRLADKTPGELIDAVKAANITAPNLRRIPELHNALAAAKVIPF